MKTFFLIIFVALGNLYCNAQCNGWQLQNPLPTNSTLKSVCFIDSTGYAVGDYGTIIKTTNNGIDWTNIRSTVPLGHLNSVYFTDVNTGYAVGVGGIIIKTTNAGTSWTTLTSGTTNGLNSVCFTNANTGYAVGFGGTIIKTTNAGNSWTTLTSGTTNRLNSVYFTDANTVYTVGVGGIIIKTTNAGTSWTTLTSGTTNGLNSICFTDVNNGYVVGDNGKVFKTTNAGDSWTTTTNVTSSDLYSVYFTDANTGYALGGLTGGRVIKTTNAGISWSYLTSAMQSFALYSVYFTDTDTGYAVGWGGKIIRTTNAGASWTTLTSGSRNEFKSVYFTDTDNGYAVGYGGSIIKTTNAGVNWTTLTSGTTNSLYSVYFTDANTGYAVGGLGTILKTINAGSSWATLTSGTMIGFNSVYFTDANTGYAVGYDGRIYKTTNAGMSWTLLTSGTTADLYSVYFTNANTGYAVGISAIGVATILKTTNAGISWTTLTTSGTWLYSVYFTDANTGYIVGSGGKIIKTTNAGTSWTALISGTTRNLNSVYFPDANTGYAVGDSGYIVKTINAGSSWTALTRGTGENLNSVYFTNVNTGYVVGKIETILKTTNGGETLLPESSNSITGATIVCQGESSVNYTIPSIANATSYIWTLPNGASGISATNSITVNYGASAVSGNIFVKGHNDCGDGTPSTLSILVNPLPVSAETISGTATACQGQNSVIYNVPIIANATSYIWTLPNGATGTSTTNSISVNYGASAVSGNITVKGHNDCGDGAIATLAITVNSLVANAGTISGVATACQGQNSVIYNVPTIDNATSYIWTLPNGATGTSATNSITVNYGASAVSGNITVKGHNSCGDGAVSTLAIIVNPLPVSAGTISGASTACQGQNSVTYNVPTITNATSYIWTLPNGATGTSTTNSITVNYGASAVSGSITVKGHNDCGDGAIATLPITVNLLVASAGTISGAATACQGQNSVTYNVPTITNATSYIWTLPNGATGTSTTNSITVNYGASAVSGNITVKGHNDCGDGAISTLAITVNSLVASAGTISGVATACQGQNSVTYNVPTIANATSYIWTLPNGATGTSTTNSITVNYGASAVSGNITVKGHNSCGDGAISTLPITVNPRPSSAGNISGATTVCLPENAVTYTVPTISNATSYIWTLPNGATETSTTNSIIVNYGTIAPGSTSITVKGHNDCGDGAISTLPITITQTPATPNISNIGNNVLSSSSTSGNQWYNQNGIINGAISQNYTATANGSFYVIVKVGDCYSDSSSHIQITNTGIENNISNDVFSIYPNPTKNSLNISVTQKLIGSEFTITDQLGRTVITGKLTAENTVVEVGNLSNGIYLLRIGANGQQTFKVVKE